LKNKMPRIYFCFSQTTMQLTKDILQLIFLELDHGRAMFNFSELSRRCHQVFRQNIIIESRYYYDYQVRIRSMVNKQNQYHGIYRRWYIDGKLGCDCNYVRGQLHGYCKEWYSNGGRCYTVNIRHGMKYGTCYYWYTNGNRKYIENYLHNQLHGLVREYFWNGSMCCEDYYHHGQKIEK